MGIENKYFFNLALPPNVASSSEVSSPVRAIFQRQENVVDFQMQGTSSVVISPSPESFHLLLFLDILRREDLCLWSKVTAGHISVVRLGEWNVLDDKYGRPATPGLPDIQVQSCYASAISLHYTRDNVKWIESWIYLCRYVIFIYQLEPSINLKCYSYWKGTFLLRGWN